ncbi:hypothetical protein CEE37_11370 [candidate division LCP-89 bacterium B3_LCP]|uniref:Gingipain R n=1 Tax=candidate division LCP-89 bacterium B3_LCP TaxID=2012998 RepID=A0A532UVP7_UNCL8|nr:MAG: hypothetical protein CEE37_11370 [candidate division LCP-89 bacterium B3_LCP]
MGDVRMKIRQIMICLVVLLLGLTVAHAEYLQLRADVQDDRSQINVLQHDNNQVQIEVRLAGLELFEGALDGRNWDRVMIPGGGFNLELGCPEVPHFTRLLAIPDRSGARVEFEALETTVLTGIDLMPAQGVEPEEHEKHKTASSYDEGVYSQDALYPVIEAVTGEPAIIRGLRVIPVQMNPIRYNPVTGELHIIHRYKITIHFEGTDLRNVPQRPMRSVSRAWYRTMGNMIMNLDQQGLDEIKLGSYLIVCENNNNLVDNLLPALVDWKIRKGHTVAIETFSPGSSNNTIKNIIQNAYNTWEVPPEYVLLFGDTAGDYSLPGWSPDGIDHPYSQLDGGDILADVAVGRLPADDDYEAAVMINKVLFYEKMPYTANSDWYHQGCLVAGSSSGGFSSIMTNRWIKARMVDREYTRIDTFWHWMSGSVATTLNNAINDGVLYVNYRGYWGMENFTTSMINSLTNGRKLPFVVTITCDTGGFDGYSESFMERFSNVGSPTTPKGAIGAIGTATTGTHTKYNNTVADGIYAGIFDEGITQPGNALNRGKLEMYNAYQAHQSGTVENYSKWNALAGDPGLELFTHAIQYMECTIPTTVSWGENSLTLAVSETGVGALEDAVVCFYKEYDLHDVGLTDAAGQITLPLDLISAGNVKITITKQNFYPIVDSLDVVQAAVAVGYYDHSVDDDNNGTSSGDNDGIINPGETVELPLTFKNFGSSTTATSVSVTATESDDFATLGDDFETFPNISAGSTANSQDDLDIDIAADCPNGHVIQLILDTQTDQGSWDGLLELEVVSYDMMVRSAYATGSDTLLSPGETSDFVLEVGNIGDKTASSLSATVTSLSSYVTVNDDYASFGTVNVGVTATCSGNPFNLTASEETPPGFLANLEVVFTSSTGATQTDTITIALGVKTMNDPSGPDEYGYYCFDNSDYAYPKAPTYDWVEIDPSYGGSGFQLVIYDSYENDDMSITLPLPFTFRYYGEDVDVITVCSNGWISSNADAAFANFANYPIPSCMGPTGLIAGFWDDLITGSNGYVFAKDDTENHRVIIEWSRMRNMDDTWVRETFEIILFDPVHYPTPTGDGEILFQYYDITETSGDPQDNPYSTVGIQSPDHQDGIEVVYWNTYNDPTVAHVQNGRAYLFTTDFDYTPPGAPEMVVEVDYVSGSPVPAGGGNLYYGIWGENQGTTAIDYDIWIDKIYESSDTTTLILREITNYQPGWQINRPDAWYPIPSNWPGGSYELRIYSGWHPEYDVWDTDAFSWSKSGAVDLDFDFEANLPTCSFPDPFEIVTETKTATVIPTEYELLSNYPNPFNPVTNISFALPEDGKVNLAIYNISGALVETLVDGHRTAGVHDVTFDASDVASGIYFYKLNVGDFNATGKMVLMK